MYNSALQPADKNVGGIAFKLDIILVVERDQNKKKNGMKMEIFLKKEFLNMAVAPPS